LLELSRAVNQPAKGQILLPQAGAQPIGEATSKFHEVPPMQLNYQKLLN
jgi:hypothetical protein